MKRRSQPRSRAAGEKPGPSSATSMTRRTPATSQETATRERACSAALATRFATARAKLVRSSGASGAPATVGPMAASSFTPRARAIWAASARTCSQSSAGRMGALSAPPDPREASMSRCT